MGKEAKRLKDIHHEIVVLTGLVEALTNKVERLLKLIVDHSEAPLPYIPPTTPYYIEPHQWDKTGQPIPPHGGITWNDTDTESLNPGEVFGMSGHPSYPQPPSSFVSSEDVAQAIIDRSFSEQFGYDRDGWEGTD